MLESYKGTYGFSAVAVTIIAAVVIAGGAVAVSMSGSSSGDTEAVEDPTTEESGEASAEGSEITTDFACNGGESAKLSFDGGTDVQLTLPSGEVKTVSRTRVGGETQFQEVDGSVVFRNTPEGAVIEQDGEVVASGCVNAAIESSQSNGSTDDVGATSGSSVQMNTNTQVGATTSPDASSIDTEVNAETKADINIDTGSN